MSSVIDWMKRQAPTRESFERSRFLRPYSKRIFVPALWRFTRRSVPRGVALGLLVGIFLLIPGVQIMAAALLALPVRANIPVAAAMTFLSMPATTPFILAASIYVGNAMFHLHADLAGFMEIIEPGVPMSTRIGWFLSDAAPALLIGLAVIAVVSAVVGYGLAVVGWRWWLVRKWRARSASRLAS
jgi:uncharacterized protein